MSLLHIYKSGSNIFSGVLQHTYVSAYEKLAAGEAINVLVVGDSIGQGAGATSGKGWASMLPSEIESEYGSKCNITNISMGGNTSYAGIVRVNTLEDDIDYDLIIVCFGENDSESELSSEYEALIRAIKTRYGSGNIISILESSQREYTNKINTIIDIADYYGIPVADTIDAFNTSGYSYEELVNAPDDLTHPNDLGHELYLSTIMDVINAQVAKISQFDEVSNNYKDMLYFDRKDMSLSGVYKYKLTIDKSITADIGLYRNYLPGENNVKVYVDGVLIYDSNDTWNSAEQSHIYKITSEPVYIEKEVEIEFSSFDLAKRFYGISFTNVSLCE
ncbi:MAG: SGNH/GDSL hydrolase family protein [Butyrivibrio sp.]|uniref:SGNH/GDSL hydrolase family protein n=1 Tax=Butyrivibrio sp. TaxID=28121 RepID=UPI0025DC2FE1|nr:SGNH/GDSL hydrolase family protein [Butyrivibrio sp.]MCR5773022.1 SGNH/GDSL hydrolase family protein [Butyrivibrio sp.]